MVSKNEAKFVKSLQNRKYREQHQLFVVEGGKNILEILNSFFQVVKLYVTQEFFIQNYDELSKKDIEIAIVDEKFLISNGSYLSNNAGLALVKLKRFTIDLIDFHQNILILDQIQDPGNLGTIIRTADWFGVNQVICSNDSVDCYNPKVVNSTMGSLGRVKIMYSDLCHFFKILPHSHVLAAVLDGNPIKETPLQKPFTLVIGSESKGIRNEVLNFCNYKVTIPRISSYADSLNVSIACGILLYEITSRINWN